MTPRGVRSKEPGPRVAADRGAGATPLPGGKPVVVRVTVPRNVLPRYRSRKIVTPGGVESSNGATSMPTRSPPTPAVNTWPGLCCRATPRLPDETRFAWSRLTVHAPATWAELRLTTAQSPSTKLRPRRRRTVGLPHAARAFLPTSARLEVAM